MISYPATRIWEAELRAGIGGQDRMLSATWNLDVLHRAACCEANARDAFAEGLEVVGYGWLDRAREYLVVEARRIAA